ncbi:MAG TPA: class I SAM-dependent methyltransferase [Myxococcota bacterium]
MSLDDTRRSWNVATRQHNAHKRDQAAWLRENSTLFDDEVMLVADVVGELRGKRMLHTLCNSGQDTLSWAKRGADIVGVDLSDEAIATAQQLSADSGIAARFVCSEATAFLESTSERFDVVVGSYGCLCWIEDLPRFMRGVRRVLVDGGRAVFLEFHPLVWSFDGSFAATKDPYFARAPFVAPVQDYVGAAAGALSPSGHIADVATIIGSVDVDNPHAASSWQHTTADMVTALLSAGLTLTTLREYAHSNGCRVIDGLVVDADRRWTVPAPYASLPLMLGLAAAR